MTERGTNADSGIDFSGKIALVKYGGNFRGLKIKGTQDTARLAYIQSSG